MPACPVAALDFPYAAAEESRYRARVAARSAAPGPPYRLVVFGYLGRNRRLEALLEALAAMGEREQFRLDICGELWDEGQVRTQIEQLGLNSLVNLYGFLPDGQVEQKLSTAHLAINLRYPSMGEASLSQLQFWDYGLPTLVTRTGWYTSLPEDAVAFVRPEHEVADIQAHLRAFLADPGAFRAMGERGRQSLKEPRSGEICRCDGAVRRGSITGIAACFRSGARPKNRKRPKGVAAGRREPIHVRSRQQRDLHDF